MQDEMYYLNHASCIIIRLYSYSFVKIRG